MIRAVIASIASSGSKLIQHCRRKYSEGSIDRFSTSHWYLRQWWSRRSSHGTSQPPFASRNMNFASGKRSQTPPAVMNAMLAITSNGFAIPWVKTWSGIASEGWSGSKSSTYRPLASIGARQPQTLRRARKIGGEERVQRDGHAGVRRRLPDRVVDRVVERPPVDRRVRPHEHRHHAGERRHPADLGGDARDVVLLVHRRYRARTEETALTLRHVVRAPVVVRAGLYPGEVHVALALQGQEHRRVQDGEVDVVLVHVLQARLRVPCRGTRLRVAHLAAERARPVLVTRTGHTGSRHAVRRRSVPVVEEPLLAVGVGLDVPDAVPVLRGCVVGHRGRVLEDVPVGVDVTKAVRGRHPRSSLSSPSEYTTRPRRRQRDRANAAARRNRTVKTVRQSATQRREHLASRNFRSLRLGPPIGAPRQG